MSTQSSRYCRAVHNWLQWALRLLCATLLFVLDSPGQLWVSMPNQLTGCHFQSYEGLNRKSVGPQMDPCIGCVPRKLQGHPKLKGKFNQLACKSQS